MIICGYQGVGKSTYCRNNPTTTVDLDSSNYKKEKAWVVQYINDALSYSDKTVFISAHKDVIEYLYENKIPFEILVPILNKDAWRSRLEFRYFKNPTLGNYKAIRDFEKNFEIDMAFYKSYEAKGVKVHKINAKIVTNIAEAIDN